MGGAPLAAIGGTTLMGGYTAAALASVLIVLVIDLFVLRTRLVTTRLFWASYAIVVFFQLIVNGILTGYGIVNYDPTVITGFRVVFAPVEDLGFGFALITLTLVLWTKTEHSRRAVR